ncbi:hypothetical protein M9H77_34566 [Catharanthus roseus]|uniref:Uncharacterized protein n=1 Tax=Catharanthus roseus TaxID=4058 RepID=A0ACB9ZLK7_CATRO|nr:hypothetical protein M9H77_34566 [Catharanthus roseus]
MITIEEENITIVQRRFIHVKRATMGDTDYQHLRPILSDPTSTPWQLNGVYDPNNKRVGSANIQERLDRDDKEFLVGNVDDGKCKLFLRTRDSICKPKEAGGLGFRKLEKTIRPSRFGLSCLNLNTYVEEVEEVTNPTNSFPLSSVEKVNLLHFVGVIIEVTWMTRNRLQHGEKIESGKNLEKMICAQAIRYSMVVTKRKLKQPQFNNQISWCPPPKDWVNVNLPCVSRNHNGEILDACICSFEPCDPFVLEAKAVVQGLKKAKEKGYKRVIIEGDAHGVIKAMNGHEEEVQWRGSPPIKVGRQILLNHSSLLIRHISRNYNWRAHIFVQWAADNYVQSGYIPNATLPLELFVITVKL